MFAEFHVREDELNSDFLKKIKGMFRNKHISITIETEDETEYLLKSETNREALLNSMDQVAKGKTVKYEFGKNGLNSKH